MCSGHVGLEHPDVVYPLTGLAILYHIQKKIAEAELLYQRVLHIWKQGLKSPDATPNNTFSTDSRHGSDVPIVNPFPDK